MREAHQQLANFMREQVAERKAEIHGQDQVSKTKDDAFTMLVRANEDESGKLRLDDQELVRLPSCWVSYQCGELTMEDGNARSATFSSCFLPDMVKFITTCPSHDLMRIFLIETTAHTLAATLGFLGLYEDIQEEVFEQIVSVVGLDRDPVRRDSMTSPMSPEIEQIRSTKIMPASIRSSPRSMRRCACSVRQCPSSCFTAHDDNTISQRLASF